MLSDGKNAPLATAIIPPISIDDFILSFGVEAFLKDKLEFCIGGIGLKTLGG